MSCTAMLSCQFIDALGPPEMERADLLALVCDVYCDLLLSHLVSWDRCGT